MLLLMIPTRVRSGIGKTGWACCTVKFGWGGSGNVGSTGEGTGVGCTRTPGGDCGEMGCVPGGAFGNGVGSGFCPGGCVAGLTGVGRGVGVCATTLSAARTETVSSRANVAIFEETFIGVLLKNSKREQLDYYNLIPDTQFFVNWYPKPDT